MSEGNYGVVRPTLCPYCSTQLDDATNLRKNDAKAKPGDLSVCIHCGGFLQFDNGMGLVVLDAATFRHLNEPIQDELLDYQRVIRSRSREHGG